MSRTFKQFGHGYGATPVNIVAQIDGNTVYSGDVTSSDAPVPDSWSPGQDPNVECFSWTEAISNVQTRSLTITVTGGTLQLGQTLAQGNVANAAQYGPIYDVAVGDEVYGDPLTNVMIDGEEQVRPLDELPGQWNWNIPAGSVFTAVINSNIFPTGNV